MQIILLVGLGNPGKEYARTRHNAGFMFADYFWKNNRDNFSDWEEKKKLKSLVSTGKTNDKKIILLKPQTFMNLSGEALKSVLKFYKLKLSDLIVIHDEIDLQLGKYKFSKDSSSAGHKGAQSVIDTLGTKNFTRVRIGVDNRGEKKIATEKYVLGKFTSTELKILRKTLEEAVNEFPDNVI